MDEVVRQFVVNQKKWRIGRYLGSGGFGEVHEVFTDSGVPFALKVPFQRYDENDAEQRELLEKDLARLELVKAVQGHPHILTLIGYWNICGYLVTIWELSREGTLEDFLKIKRQTGARGLPASTALRFLSKAAEGIDYLNNLGIYHRDIKPSNLFFCGGQVKVGDLGLIKCAGASTVTHSAKGTYGYLPLEAYDQRKLTRTIDLYALAATYVKLRTGEEPFGKPPEVFHRQASGAYCREGLSPAEVFFLDAALHPDPNKRPQNGVRQWVRDLQKGLSNPAKPAQPKTAANPKPKKKTASGKSPQRQASPAPDVAHVQPSAAATAAGAAAEEGSSDNWLWLMFGAAAAVAGYFLFGRPLFK